MEGLTRCMFISCVLLAGCKRTTPPTGEPSFKGGLQSLGSQLEKERSQRPQGVLTVEQVLSELKMKGIPATAPRQVLAAILGARYCATSQIEKEVALAICEFSSPAEADAGRRVSLQRFAELKERSLYLNGSTLLTVTKLVDSPSAKARATLLADLFASLRGQPPIHP